MVDIEKNHQINHALSNLYELYCKDYLNTYCSASGISGGILRDELELLHPKIVVCCGTAEAFRVHVPAFPGTVISMPHPAARISTIKTLQYIKAQVSR